MSDKETGVDLAVLPRAVELQVLDAGELALHYHFANIADAMETLLFIKDFFPSARFVIQPVLH